jgi:hypothetical protein
MKLLLWLFNTRGELLRFPCQCRPEVPAYTQEYEKTDRKEHIKICSYGKCLHVDVALKVSSEYSLSMT